MELSAALAAVVDKANNDESCAHTAFPEIAGNDEIMHLIGEVSYRLGTFGVESGLVHPLAMVNEEAIKAMHHGLILAAALGFALATAGETDAAVLGALTLEDLGALADKWGEVGQ